MQIVVIWYSVCIHNRVVEQEKKNYAFYLEDICKITTWEIPLIKLCSKHYKIIASLLFMNSPPSRSFELGFDTWLCIYISTRGNCLVFWELLEKQNERYKQTGGFNTTQFMSDSLITPYYGSVISFLMYSS